MFPVHSCSLVILAKASWIFQKERGRLNLFLVLILIAVVQLVWKIGRISVYHHSRYILYWLKSIQLHIILFRNYSILFSSEPVGCNT